MKINRILSAVILTTFLFALGTPAGARSVVNVGPGSINFGNQTVNTIAAPVTVTFANNSRAKVTVVSVSLSLVQFAYAGPSLPITLKPGQTFSGVVSFSPTAVQTYSDALVFTRANGSTVVSQLSGAGVQGATSLDPPTSLQLTAAPCDANFNCNPGTTAAVGQFVKITSHVVFSGTTNPTGQLCVLDNGSPTNCSLIPVADENWYTNSLTAGTHALTATYAGNSTFGASNSGSVSVVVGSSPASVSPSTQTTPTITVPPGNQSVTAGQTATFSVTAAGTSPLMYQWNKGGVAIVGATSASYTTAATKTSDNGSAFTVTVSNSVGNVTSGAAILSVGTTASGQLTANPPSLNFGNVNMGSNGSLTVSLTNSGNASVTISTVGISGAGFNASGGSGAMLSPGQSATLNATFTPSTTGSASGRITVNSNAANSQLQINLAGAGVQPQVTSIMVTPANQTLASGTQMQFTAVDNFGNDITSSVTWSSSDSSIVSITPSGMATGLTNGAVTIQATK